MENTGIRFPGNLDPTAQEFRPSYTTHLPFVLPPNIYYPYPSPPPAGPVPYHPTATFVPPIQPLPPPVLPSVTVTPTRTLLLSSVPTDVSESTVRRELEVFGDVRAVQMERVRDGIVTVHFYDLRNAIEALTEIQVQHMQQQCRVRKHFDGLLSLTSYGNNSHAPPHPPPARGLISGRAIWAQFTIPFTAGLPDGNNQGTIVIFNLGHEVSGNQLREIFEAFGSVKELRETPLKRNQRFVEFYDVRHAAKALANVNGSEINGRHVVVEFSRPGGNIKRFSNSTAAHHHHRPPPPLTPACSRPCFTPQMNRKPGSSSGRKGTKKSAFAAVALEASVSGLSLRSESCNLKKNSVVKVITKTPELQHRGGGGNGGGNGGGARSKQWKGTRQIKERYDPRFLIKEDAVFAAEPSRRDSRTTVMIKNIPNKYSQKLLLNMLDNHCIHCNEQIDDGDDQQPLSSYDFVYLPIDFINKCNVGYGFVNMTSPEATWRLYKAFHLQNWEVFNSKKICEVSYARLQGVEALKEHFKTSKFPCEDEEYMPVLFSPPRDGRRLTEPVPIIGRIPHQHHRSNSSSSSSPSSPTINKTQELCLIMEDSDGFFIGGSSDTTTNHNDDDEDEGDCGGSCSGGVYD